MGDYRPREKSAAYTSLGPSNRTVPGAPPGRPLRCAFPASRKPGAAVHGHPLAACGEPMAGARPRCAGPRPGRALVYPCPSPVTT
jgi:hypothetical protein